MVTVEMRSVNNRYLDCHFRLPEALRHLEGPLRQDISAHLHRGKVEVQVKYQLFGEANALHINKERLSAMVTALHTVAELAPSATPPDQLALLLAPGVIEQQELDAELLEAAVREALAITVQRMVAARREEGEKLARMVASRVEQMRALLAELKAHLDVLKAAQQTRIRERIEQVSSQPDEKRLEEELVYYAQRSDVEEEIDRLEAHLGAIDDALASDKPCGRRLDFLMQELNREANTLSSKSTALTTTNTAVEFKVLIEQMREQIQNIE